MKKNKHRKKTPRYVEEQYWSTLMMVDDELVDRINVWDFYYFAAATIVPLLEDFRDVAAFKITKSRSIFANRPPEEWISTTEFSDMISSINLLVRYFNEGALVYKGREIDFARGDNIADLSNALHLFANCLPYLNDRHFKISEERYGDAPTGRHCDFDELCNLDKTIARRIFPTLQTFAAASIFPPKYFNHMYDSYAIPDSSRLRNNIGWDKWKEALETMVESWKWILERKPEVTPEGLENVPENIYYGLHLFAEYLPEMQND